MPSLPPRDWRSPSPLLIAAILIALAFSAAWRTTNDLAWPNEHDLYRDMASARSMLREGFGHDPCYLGEKLWYNPLTPLAMAAAHKLSGLPLEVAVARCGTWINLLAPILFYAMASVLLGRWTALLALSGFLFSVGGAFPSWAAATYSPWLYPVNFAQGFFYLLVIRLAALRGQTLRTGWALTAGVLLGVTFLAHTAPALLFGFLLLSLLVQRAPDAGPAPIRDWRRLVLPLALLGGAAAVVALPYLWSIVGHYHLRLVNTLPNGFVPDFLGYSSIPLMVKRHLEPPVLVAWFGLYLVLRRRCDPGLRRILLPWVGLTALAVFYGYLVAGFAKLGVRLPLVVPAFHFLFYFKAALALLFGIGAMELGRIAAARLSRRFALPAGPWSHRLGLALALLMAAWNVRAYLDRYDFRQARNEALMHGRERERIAVHDWALAHAGPGEVFLASDDMGLFGVCPAGSKVVAVDPYMSSPYVDCQVRRRDRDRMFELLAAGNDAEFRSLASAWHVTHVVDESAGQGISPALRGRVLDEVLAVGRVRVFRLAPQQ